MRILDNVSDGSLDEVVLYFTYREAEVLYERLNRLLEQPDNHSCCVSSSDSEKELTITIYDPVEITSS